MIRASFKYLVIFFGGYATAVSTANTSLDMAGKINEWLKPSPTISISEIYLRENEIVVQPSAVFPELRLGPAMYNENGDRVTKLKAPAVKTRLRVDSEVSDATTFRNLRLCLVSDNSKPCRSSMRYFVDNEKYNPEEEPNASINRTGKGTEYVYVSFVGLDVARFLGERVAIAWDDVSGQSYLSKSVLLPKDADSTVTFFDPPI